MSFSDVLPQCPVQITHHTRWLDLFFHRPSGVPALPPVGGVHTLVAIRPEQFQAAYDLVRRRYSWRGYSLAEHSVRERFTLLAEKCGELLATLTVRPQSRLYAEDTYSADIKSLRAQGRRVGELVTLAIETGVDWKLALGALVQSAWWVTRILHGLTDVVIEVNPRHVRFYERAFGFVVAAAGGVCSRVGAPSVLMRLELEQFGHRLRGSPTLGLGQKS